MIANLGLCLWSYLMDFSYEQLITIFATCTAGKISLEMNHQSDDFFFFLYLTFDLTKNTKQSHILFVISLSLDLSLSLSLSK